MVLNDIIELKKKRVEVLSKNLDGIKELLKTAPVPISFKNAVFREGKISIIGEIKQASPSAGIIRKDFLPIDLAKTYQKFKINAISVLTEEDFFLGKINFIEQIKKEIVLPILRKDFVFDSAQVIESRAVGADAILLIARIVGEKQLAALYAQAKDLGMDVLVEIHTEKELRRALKMGADIIGINNRNLDTLKIDVNRTKKLAPFIPNHVVKISESGISTLKDVLLMKGMGMNAVLIGEAFMKAANIENKIKELNLDA